MTAFRIGRRMVGEDHPTYFVADIAANHDGSLDRALHLIALAADAGADAAKFQNFTAETIVSGPGFRALGTKVSHQATWERDVVDVYRATSVPTDWTPVLVEACDAVGIDFFTAAYDLDLIDELDPYVCAWKVGSGDITWHEALHRMAASGKPILLATGASDMAEVEDAVSQLGEVELVLMQCNTNYTGSIDNFRHVELRVLRTFAELYPNAVLGLSDHTPGCAAVLGAVALGARVIEKHFTDDPARTGPDHGFSLDPRSWREMVDRTRELEAALGTGAKRVMENERDTVVVQRRAVRATNDLAAGTVVQRRDLTVLRPCPAGATPPSRIGSIVGRRLRHAVESGALVGPDDVD